MHSAVSDKDLLTECSITILRKMKKYHPANIGNVLVLLIKLGKPTRLKGSKELN